MFTWGNKAKHCCVMSTNFIFSKVCWKRPTIFCLYISSNLSCPQFEFFLKLKVMGSNPGYLLIFFSTLLHTLNQLTCRPPLTSLHHGCQSHQLLHFWLLKFLELAVVEYLWRLYPPLRTSNRSFWVMRLSLVILFRLATNRYCFDDYSLFWLWCEIFGFWLPLVLSKWDNLAFSVCILFEESVFIFQFFNDKIHS